MFLRDAGKAHVAFFFLAPCYNGGAAGFDKIDTIGGAIDRQVGDTVRAAVAIDLGGTNMKGAIVNEDGHILLKDEVPTLAEKGATDVLHRMQGFIRDLSAQAGLQIGQLAGVGIGIPGFIDDASGVAVEVINMGWKNVSVRSVLSEALGLSVYMDNDANVAALGEAWTGGGRGRKIALCVTLGTGVGGGIVVDGRILRGMNTMAGEIGHIVLEPGGAPCNCGLHGCLETISSATGVVRLAREAMATGVSSAMHAEGLTAEDVFHSAEAGDEAAKRAVAHAIEALGRGLAIGANILNPEVIVVGGGMSKAGDALFEPLHKAFSRYVLGRVGEAVTIEPATLGNDAGVVGAARLALSA